MDMVINFVAALAAFGMILAGCVYLFSPGEARKLLKTLFVALGALLFFAMLLTELARNADPLAAFVAIALVSVVAYVIRERRCKRERQPRHFARAERTPVMPRTEEDA